MKMTESIETEMDKGALEPRKKRECVSQKEVFDSDEGMSRSLWLSSCMFCQLYCLLN
jgi:hypothetical protein